ncbi:MAG TPA: pyridoxamine 5'-phosphate oxidase family protein [Solirubrobacteraceae bacterium]|jgi:uncharacterized protein YhbP (UPF0306 family)|nr:pyridoxamine 5'-phosphate oxidase family protein [Solirubrobacteraceae bacterium]
MTIELPDHIAGYISSQGTLTLATASPDAQPHASTFLYVNDGTDLFFWTRTGTTTVRHLDENPRVSFAIDRYDSDLRHSQGVQGTGQASPVVVGEDIARVAMMFGDKFPELSPGATTTIMFFKVTPDMLSYIDNSGTASQIQGEEFGAEFHKDFRATA